MKNLVANGLAVLALAAGALAIAVSTGLLPAREPAPIDTEKLVLPTLPKDTSARLRAAAGATLNGSRVRAFSLCAAPDQGAHLRAVPQATGAQFLFVWCRGGYQLFSVDAIGRQPIVTMHASLPTNMPRPGGAAMADLTADGVADLVIGVAPEEGVVHAPGSGIFLVRGRAQGGYQTALPLIETPVIGLALVQMRAQSASPDLFVLTRGDAAAQRYAQLVWFEAGPTPLKKSTFDAGLWPRDLSVAQLAEQGAPTLLVVASNAGRVIAVSPLDPPAEAVREVSLPDAAQLCAATDRRFVLARTPHDLVRVAGGASLALAPWFRDAKVGSCATGDLDRDGAPDALAVTDAGVIWLRDESATGAIELTLPTGFRALDVAYGVGDTARVVALTLDVERKQLVLLSGSALPWVQGLGTLDFTVEPARNAPTVAEIPLE